MRIDILTLFPEMFQSVFEASILKRRLEKKDIEINLVNFRDYTEDKNKKVDDYPYGGVAGMLLMIQPIYDCLKAIKTENSVVCLISPQGQTYNQKLCQEMTKIEHLILICGHYEGFDERIRSLVDMEVSIGDFILTGGELPAMILVDSIVRLIDGTIRKESHEDDSFSNGLLEYPQYTKPREFMGMSVPEVLLNGNHKKIEEYRRQESLRKTFLRRKELLDKVELTKKDLEFIKKLEEEYEKNNNA
jgi:tRNA (guanine37-N1)-methyltransferase